MDVVEGCVLCVSESVAGKEATHGSALDLLIRPNADTQG